MLVCGLFAGWNPRRVRARKTTHPFTHPYPLIKPSRVKKTLVLGVLAGLTTVFRPSTSHLSPNLSFNGPSSGIRNRFLEMQNPESQPCDVRPKRQTSVPSHLRDYDLRGPRTSSRSDPRHVHQAGPHHHRSASSLRRQSSANQRKTPWCSSPTKSQRSTLPSYRCVRIMLSSVSSFRA